jgi:hypothetical protein
VHQVSVWAAIDIAGAAGVDEADRVPVFVDNRRPRHTANCVKAVKHQRAAPVHDLARGPFASQQQHTPGYGAFLSFWRLDWNNGERGARTVIRTAAGGFRSGGGGLGFQKGALRARQALV